ncbi:MAG: hypothetical protein P1Q69_02085 [Candidatus Thorarchaeota archaeon]|nr:hypothetical protein [Candidatus Thorarchaeota archaeon]
MVEGCSCGRRCSDCPYESICGGCIEDRCIHNKKSTRSEASCLFSDLNGLSCSHKVDLPSNFELAPPSMLEDAVKEFQSCSIEPVPKERHFPLVIPEVSNVSPTTARLGVWPDEGKWANPFMDMIAWDVTGNLFDKPRGAPWVFEPDNCGSYDWKEILGPEKNWIHDILLIDRLPDRIALQTPPTASIVLLLNRLQTYYPSLLYDDDAPYPWLVSHGYPSYINWPPAWHFNLGIRMLSSLLAYLVNQEDGYLNIEPGAMYADGSRETTQHLPLPYIMGPNGKHLLWNPDERTRKYTEMEWPRFPGIIPFIPGSDTAQTTWFAKMMVKAGFSKFALDALNSIGHENFNGIDPAIQSLRASGAENVLLYGPYPLHIPSMERPVHGVSYIPSAIHIDLTDFPPRYWRDTEKHDSKEKWTDIPSYKTTPLGDLSEKEWIRRCDCDACRNATVGEVDPRSIFRFGHFLNAVDDWVFKVQDLPEDKPTFPNGNQCLWFQGPSYTSFRQCMQYPLESLCENHFGIIKSFKIDPTNVKIRLSDGTQTGVHCIRWGTNDDLYKWIDEFPDLEE